MLMDTVILEYKHTDRDNNWLFCIEWLAYDSKVKTGA